MSQNPPPDNVAQSTISESEEEESQESLMQSCQTLINSFHDQQRSANPPQVSMHVPNRLVSRLTKLFNRYQLRFNNYRKWEEDAAARLNDDRAQFDRENAAMIAERSCLQQKAVTMDTDQQTIVKTLTQLLAKHEAFDATHEDKLKALEKQRVEYDQRLNALKGKYDQVDTDRKVEREQYEARLDALQEMITKSW